jgi:hypothetical protein
VIQSRSGNCPGKAAQARATEFASNMGMTPNEERDA